MKNVFGFLSVLGIFGIVIGAIAAMMSDGDPRPYIVIYASASAFLLCGAIWKHLDNQELIIRLLKGDKDDKDDENINVFSELSRKIKSLFGADNNYCE